MFYNFYTVISTAIAQTTMDSRTKTEASEDDKPMTTSITLSLRALNGLLTRTIKNVEKVVRTTQSGAPVLIH